MLIICLIVVYLAHLSDAYPATLLLPLLKKMRGENEMENLMGPDKDREITYWSP